MPSEAAPAVPTTDIPAEALARQSVDPGSNVVEVRSKTGQDDEPTSVLCCIPNEEKVIVWKEVSAFSEVEYQGFRGFVDARNLHERKYRLLLNLRVRGPAAEHHRQATEAVAREFDAHQVWDALREGRTYTHFTLVYDFEADAQQLQELAGCLGCFAAEQRQVPMRMLGAGRFGDRVVFLDVDHRQSHEQASRIHQDLLSRLRSQLPWIPEEAMRAPAWHATVARAFGDDPEKCSRMHDFLAKLASEPVDFLFDNITVMAKAGPPEPYMSTALPVMTFELPQ